MQRMNAALTLLIVLLVSPLANASFELIQDSSTHFRVAPLLNPIVQERLLDGHSLLSSKVAWAFGIGFEVPIVNWFNSGFIIQFNTGLPNLLPVSDLTGIAKFQWPTRLAGGNFAPYVIIPLGVSYTTVPVVDEIARRSPSDPALREKLYDNGVGFNGSLSAGLEYFPITYIGGYAEAGYRATVLFHQILRGTDETPSWRYASYWIRGFTVSFGTKIAF